MKLWWEAWRAHTALPRTERENVLSEITLADGVRVLVEQRPFTLRFRQPNRIDVSFCDRLWYHATVSWPDGTVVDGKFGTSDAVAQWIAMLPHDVPRVLCPRSYPMLVHDARRPCPIGDTDCRHDRMWKSVIEPVIERRPIDKSHAWVLDPIVVHVGAAWGLHLTVWWVIESTVQTSQSFSIVIWQTSWPALLQDADAILYAGKPPSQAMPW